MNIKRIFSVLLTSAIVALAFTSCAKKVEETISLICYSLASKRGNHRR